MQYFHDHFVIVARAPDHSRAIIHFENLRIAGCIEHQIPPELLEIAELSQAEVRDILPDSAEHREPDEECDFLESPLEILLGISNSLDRTNLAAHGGKYLLQQLKR
jgi:hypothetical protein